jgi:hypothetical protein
LEKDHAESKGAMPTDTLREEPKECHAVFYPQQSPQLCIGTL